MNIYIYLNSKIKFSLCFLAVFLTIGVYRVSAATYYISPSGSDTTGSGTISSPWFSLNKAWTSLVAGDTLYLRGGTYAFSSQQYLTGKNGSSGNMINVFAYPGENPNLTKSSSYTESSNHGIFFSGDYVYFKGLEISGYTQPTSTALTYGFRVENSNYNIFEQLNIHDNGLGMSMANYGTTAHNTGNLILNSDFHHNQDPLTDGDPYGNADGLDFGWITHPEDVNTVRGCRFWYNTDDGLDLYKNDGQVIVENNWSFKNGYIPDTSTHGGGDGNGFKLGNSINGYPNDVKRILKNNISFDNYANGFDLNGGRFKTQLYNNTSYRNGNRGFRMADDFYNESLVHTAKNNIGYSNTDLQGEFSTNSIVSNNTFLLAGGTNNNYSVSDTDFISVDSTGMDGTRQSDGSLPTVNFLRLAQSSDLIDGGVDVGLTYNGSAPDLGAYESNYDTTSPVISSFTIPSSSSSKTISITSFTATDNTAVTGYLLNESSSTPSLSDSGWSTSIPTSYTFSSTGTKTLYAWAKDAAGNISSSVNANVSITVSSSGGGGSSGGGSSSSGGSSSVGSYASGGSTPAKTSVPATITTGTSSASKYIFENKMSMGTKSQEVKELQSYLNSLGYNCGTPDGSFGKKTFNAVKQFQLDNNIISDGIVGFGTRSILNNSITKTSTTSNSTINNIINPLVSTSTTTGITLLKYCRYMSKGNDPLEVKKLQQILINKGYMIGGADGLFGKQTLNAVIKFQKDNNLKADGVVGQVTLELLNK